MAQTLTNYAVNGSTPSTVGGTGVGIKYFPNLPGASIGVNNTTPSSTSANGQMTVPGSNRLNGQYFTVNAAGNFEVGAGGTCPTVTIALYANKGTVTSPSYTTLATTTAITAQNLTGTFYPWYLQVSLQGDSGSGIVQGKFNYQVDATASVSNTLTNNLSGINFATEPPFGLVIGITFSVSETGNSANLYQFSLEA